VIRPCAFKNSITIASCRMEYRVQYTTSVDDPDWTDLPGAQLAPVDGQLAVTDSSGLLTSARFYRVVLLQTR
jgi:hypothetical protein